ncbi:hypothetical protein BX666DRAFT_1946924 [Dichotomocladium elegans]|nr:hypothetical protein BX666DRAFT_1946924 [Dichotomocladium elegans]
MSNQEASNSSNSTVQADDLQQGSITRGSALPDEEVITQIMLAGLKVIMLRRGDQIVYKLPDEVVLSSIGDDQRAQLLSEIKALHAATLAAAARSTTSAIKSETNNTTKTIAPKQSVVPPQLLVPQVISERQDVDSDTAMRETARKLQEEYEQQQQQQQQQQHASQQGEVKTTRKYVKTGKYSKKRLHQQHHPSVTPSPIQQQQPAQPVVVVPQQAITSAAPLHQQQQQQQQQQQHPVNLPTQLVSSSILSKRLPEEENHHQEIKRRMFDSIVADHRAVLDPDYETPFKSVEDVINRLLPYHIFQYPKADLEVNKIPLDRLDLSTVELVTAQADMFQKFSAALRRATKDNKEKHIQIMLDRQKLADQRQRLTEEQARVAAEQAAKQQQELIRMQEEQARAAAAAAAAAAATSESAEAQQQRQPESAPVMISPSEPAHYMNHFPQPNALLQNPEFAQQYNQLPPEIRQQFVMHDPQRLAGMLAEHTSVSHNESPPPHQ